MQDFLCTKEDSRGGGKTVQPSPPRERKVDLCVLLPNRSKCTVSIKENSRAFEVFEVWLGGFSPPIEGDLLLDVCRRW